MSTHHLPLDIARPESPLDQLQALDQRHSEDGIGR